MIDKFAEKDVERFWSKVKRTNSEECWEWIGTKEKDGYGVFKIKRKTYKSHRISWLISKKESIENKLVCHSCDNRGCVNPGHLWLGTNKENVEDMVRKNRQRQGENHSNVKLSEKNIKEILDLYKSGYKQVDLCSKFGIGHAQLSRILSGEAWKNTKIERVKSERNKNERNGMAKLTKEDAQEIYRRSNNGENQKHIARDYDISQSLVSFIKLGKSKWI